MESSMFSPHPQSSHGLLGLALENKTERYNTISALVGAIAAISGVAWLVTLAVLHGDPLKIASFIIYGVTLKPRPFFQNSTTCPFIC